jgi:hypothetical protein
MESQSILFTSLLLCGATVFYLYLQFRLKQQQEGRKRSGRPIAPGLELAASIQPSPGVKVHLLRWRSADEAQQGEFLLVTSGPAIQVTPCQVTTCQVALSQGAISEQNRAQDSKQQDNKQQQKNEIPSLSFSASHH